MKPVLLKRNSEDFKKVRDFVNDCEGDKNIMKKLKLYSLKPYEGLEKRVLLHRDKKEEAMIFDMEFEVLKFNLLDAKHKLFLDEKTGLYYFKTSSQSKYIELPFEITEKL